jgi:hypothetical protein
VIIGLIIPGVNKFLEKIYMKLVEHFGMKVISHSNLNPYKEYLTIEDYDKKSLLFSLSRIVPNMRVSKKDVKTLINYLQNWVDTGDFEGKKEAESND